MMLGHYARAAIRRVMDAVLNVLPRYRRSSYEFVLPAATYAPWNSDAAFREAYGKIAPYTLVDRYRCFELWNLVRQTSHLDGAVLEVGVWRGGTGALLAEASRLVGSTSPVYLCDTFSGVVKAGARDGFYSGGEHADTSLRIVEALVRDTLGLSSVTILSGVFPDETGERIAGCRFRLCHIDVDVYESARGIFEWVWPRLVPGGVVVYDDYGFAWCKGITRHVEEVCRGDDRLFLHNLNGHAILVKRR